MRQIRRLKSKRAQGHVEMIISFLIFIGFVVTLLTFLNPTKSRQIDYAILSITEEKLMDEWTRNYSSISVTISNDSIAIVNEKDCFIVPDKIKLSGNLIVKNQRGNVVDAVLGSDITIKHTFGNRFYKIYSSEEFEDNTISCTSSMPLSDLDYKFGARTQFDVVMEDRLYDMIEEYNQGEEAYKALKERLGITNDFMIFVYDQDINILANASMFVPRVVEVVARDIPVVAINNTADPVELIINIRAW